MARKAATDGGKYNDIVSAAYECFFEKGYDGTSVRSIMTRAGGEIGLFYYYFDSKDDAFDRVLDRFFAHYEADFASIVAHGRRNPCRVMQDFFEYMERETAKFRAEYAAKLHRTVRWAIREHTLEIIEPYLLQVVEIQSGYYRIAPAIAPQAAAMYLTHGVGSSILHEDTNGYVARRGDFKRGISLLMGMPMDEQELRIPYPATLDDIPGWMALVHEVKEEFPGLKEADYEKRLAEYIQRNEAWVIRYNGEIAASLLFSKARRELDFLAVAPKYRRRGLAEKLVETAAAQFPVGTQLTVTTYRQGDVQGKVARMFYEALGFAPREEVTVFDYPCQKLGLTVPDGTPARKM
ncbi:GNAT family N-acetyltransferase [Caproiciproducens faecalis]|uniref:GNAT family N-acetyltransferase n=1 Tax=Caproiciproducens faecalis TaxID=2820301 RepID=A0ABS7DKS3_9FIRM|nr:GNAT family N-acetyltransferase [Caproiciproducens faecalis]MBW7571897.1 GNAT family N-acetyltransferase [Caproiciproducens faecalis]